MNSSTIGAPGAEAHGVQRKGRHRGAVMVAGRQAGLVAGVPVERRGHPQRLEDLPAEERAVGLPGGPLNDVTEQHVSRAAVGEALSRGAEQRDAGEHAQQLAGRDGPGHVQPGHVRPVHKPSGVAEQLMDAW